MTSQNRNTPSFGIGIVGFVVAVVLFGCGSVDIQPAVSETAIPSRIPIPSPLTFTPIATLEPVLPTPTIAPTPTLDIGNTMSSPKDGMPLLYVPAGEFKMGSNNGGDDEKPVHAINLDAFWIDETEVTNAMFSEFIDKTGYVTDAEKVGKSWVYQEDSWQEVAGTDWAHPLGPASGISNIMNYPVVHVSWNDAKDYCEWVDRRLPTEAEWEKAASWDNEQGIKYIYPWGNDFNGNLLNFCDKNCSFSWADRNSDDGYEFISPVGTYPAGASPYGALDMAGNVWEWTSDWYDAYPGNSESNSAFGITHRVLRGGSWNYYLDLARSTSRNWSDPTSSGSYLGFRCSRSP